MKLIEDNQIDKDERPKHPCEFLKNIDPIQYLRPYYVFGEKLADVDKVQHFLMNRSHITWLLRTLGSDIKKMYSRKPELRVAENLLGPNYIEVRLPDENLIPTDSTELAKMYLRNLRDKAEKLDAPYEIKAHHQVVFTSSRSFC